MMPVIRNRNWLPSVFNDFFGDEWLTARPRQQASPAVNIIENDRDYRIEVAAPGMCREDFQVKIENDNELVISLEKRTERSGKCCKHGRTGTDDASATPATPEPSAASATSAASAASAAQEPQERREKPAMPEGSEKPEKQGAYLRREFSYSAFRQSFILPDEVDKAAIEASMSDGVLTLVLPKKAETQRRPECRRIEIR